MNSPTRPPIPFSKAFVFAWDYVSLYPFRLLLCLIGLLIFSFAEVMTPIISGWLVDYLVGNAEQPTFRGGLYNLSLLIGIGILFHTSKHAGWFVWSSVVSRSLKKIIDDNFYRLQRFSYDWHINTFAGANVTKVKRGMRGLQRFIDLVYYEFVPIVFVITGITISISLTYPILGISIIVVAILYAWMSIYLSLKYVLPKNRIANEVDSEVGGALADALSCNQTVKSFGNEVFEDEKMGGITSKFQNTELSQWHASEYVNIVQNTMMTMTKIMILVFALYGWSEQILTVGQFVFIMTGYNFISGYLRNIGAHTRHLFEAVGDMEDSIAFSEQDFEIEDIPDATQLQVSEGRVVFKNVDFLYQPNLGHIFKNFSLEVSPGEKIALVGHSGSGKTTFVKLLQRLYDIQGGSIEIDGQDISGVTLESLRRETILVPQEPILFHRSLAENIAYGNPDATQQQIQEAARLAHADIFIDALPGGYDTLVGERGVKLSGGERQRIAIARAILSDKKILILDEATSALDSQSEKYIQDGMAELMKRKTVFVVAHRLSTIKNVDRIIVLERGSIVEQGNHHQLVRKKDGVYHKFYTMQASGFIE